MSYFEIAIYQPRREANIGTLWRSAYQLGAAGLITIGRPYHRQPSDTAHASQRLPFRAYLTFEEFQRELPPEAALVAVEMGGIPLSQFSHPACAVYLLGSEANGLPPRVLAACQALVTIEAVRDLSYNVAVAGSIVMYQRVFAGHLAS